MKIHYLGTGEAFDDGRPNTSFILGTSKARILFDCGYSIPHQLWAVSTAPDFLDGLYVSHFHADHCFGLPAVLARMGQDGRNRPFTIFGGPGSKRAVERLLELGYPGMLGKLQFPLQCLELTPQVPYASHGWTFQIAQSRHSLPNFSVRVEASGVSVCYSGDGAPSAACRALYADADLLVHEAYYPKPVEKPSHASIGMVLALAQQVRVKSLHLVHLKRRAPRPANLTLPNPGDVFTLDGSCPA